MTILGAFLSTWDNARATFGAGTPVGGAEFDMSDQFHDLRSTVLSAATGGEWSGTAAEAYDDRNRAHAGAIGRLAELDRRLGVEVDRSAAVVTAGRRDLDSVKQWVVDAAASITEAKQQRLIRTAEHFLTHGGKVWHGRPCRFDVVLFDRLHLSHIEWIRSAFDAA